MRRLISTIVISACLALADSSLAQQGPPQNIPANAQRTAPSQGKDSKSGGSIKVRVLEGGHPVADVSIIVFPVNVASNSVGLFTSMLRPVTSDAAGRFELTSLSAGVYSVMATAPGYILSEADAAAYVRVNDNITLNLVKGGVITGKVTNSSGESMVGAVVRTIKIREADNKPSRVTGGFMSQLTESLGFLSGALGPFKTDDRGIYRIYGLGPGYYHVAAGGRGQQGFQYGPGGPYDSGAPTSFPSSTIDTASDVSVHAGEEVTGIDIRYRENRGHSISGSVTGGSGSNREAITVMLTRAGSAIVESMTAVLPTANQKAFVFDALLDGEYVVTAMSGSGSVMEGAEFINASLSQSRRVTVSGADATGVELTLEPLAQINGRAQIEPLQEAQKVGCKNGPTPRIEEVMIRARDDGKQKNDDNAVPYLSMFKDTTPGEKGDFALGFLRAGTHRLHEQLPGENLFVKSLTLPSPTPNGKPIDVAKTGVSLKAGEKLKGLVVTLSEGAAGLRGRIVVGDDKKPPQVSMRVYLVPSEPDAGDEVLRYYEADTAADGSFSLINLAPGKYWLIAREVSDQEPNDVDRRPLAWDAGARVGLRFEGDASKKVLELNRCQRVNDYVLTYTPLTKPTKPSARKTSVN